MKEFYEDPEIELIKFGMVDIITDSINPRGGDPDEEEDDL